MSGAKFAKFVRVIGLVGPPLTAGQIDLIFVTNSAIPPTSNTSNQEWNSSFFKRSSKAAKNTVHKKMDYSSFYVALAEVGMKKYPSLASSYGACVHKVIVEHVLPVSVQLIQEAAVNGSDTGMQQISSSGIY